MRSAPLRLLALTGLSLLTLACEAPGVPSRGMKEVFTEPPEIGLQVPLTDWPLTPEDEDRCYELVRSFDEGRSEGRRKLAMLLDQWEPPTRRADGSIAAIPTEVVIDATNFPNGVPDVLYAPDRDDTRSKSAVYVGHSVFREQNWGGSPLVHHLRFYVVNREPFGVRLPVAKIVCELAADNREDGRILGDFEFLTAANVRGEVTRTLYVEPGGSGLIHVFYRAGTLGQALHLRWGVEEGEPPVGQGLGVSEEEEAAGDGSGEVPSEPGEVSPEDAPKPTRSLTPEPERPPDGGGGTLPPEPTPPAGDEARPTGPPSDQLQREWQFRAILVRRYVIEKGYVTPLEQRVARGDPLPEPADGDYTEPRVTPLAPR